MFWHKSWEDEISENKELPFAGCHHLLFEEEADYPICPSCGRIIKNNFPQNSVDRSRLYLIYQKVQRVWSVKMGLVSLLFILGLSFLLPKVIGGWLLLTGNYGFDTFFTHHVHGRHTLILFTYTLYGYIPLFIFFSAGERMKRFSTFSLKIEHFHKLLYSWPVQLVLFILIVVWLSIYMPKFYGTEGERVVTRNLNLSPAQHVRAVNLFVFIHMLCNWIVAGLLFIHQLIDRRRTWWLKEANEAYLAGEC